MRAFRRDLSGRAAAALIDSYPVSQVAAQKHIDGYVCGFAADIPERVFDTGNSCQSGAARREAKLLMNLHHQVFDATGIFADKPRGHVVDDGLDREVRPDGIGFAPSVQAFVGLDFDERPRAVAVGHEEGLYRGDFHDDNAPFSGDSGLGSDSGLYLKRSPGVHSSAWQRDSMVARSIRFARLLKMAETVLA